MGQGILSRLLDAVQRQASRFSTDTYELEPLFPESAWPTPNGAAWPKHPSSSSRRCFRIFTFRRIFTASAGIFALFLVGFFCSGVPPSYSEIREFERRLPQHNISLSPPEGRQGRFLRFPDHLWGHGLNNVLQEILLQSQLAHLTDRAYVFEDYTWSHLPFPWTIHDFALRPARIPLNALISGPSAGAPMPAPRAVNTAFWKQVCSHHNVTTVTTEGAPLDVEGDVLMHWWVDRLRAVQDKPCIEVVQGAHPAFDRFFFGSPHILSLWPSLAASPIFANFTWSPLVHAAVTRNFALLRPPSAAQLVAPPHATPALSGLVAVHLRRGDFVRHCPRLCDWDARYMGFNSFPGLPDTFEPPPREEREERLEYYLEHCLPERDAIRARLGAVRREWPGLKRVYLLTNGWGSWVGGVRDALLEDGWEDVRSGQELALDAEQRHVAMAVDMAVAEKAEVFIGNGFSSLTANIVMFRMAKGMDVASNRFL